SRATAPSASSATRARRRRRRRASQAHAPPRAARRRRLGGGGSSRRRRAAPAGGARPPHPRGPPMDPSWRALMRRHVQAAREQIEKVLNGAGWPWSSRLSYWIDVLVVLEQENGES